MENPKFQEVPVCTCLIKIQNLNKDYKLLIYGHFMILIQKLDVFKILKEKLISITIIKDADLNVTAIYLLKWIVLVLK